MRQEFLVLLEKLLKEKALNAWKDGWVYGRLKEEFDELQVDELQKLAEVLKFVHGWNPTLEDLLEKQWQQDKTKWVQQEQTRLRKEQAQKEIVQQKTIEAQLINLELEALKSDLVEAGQIQEKSLPQLDLGLSLIRDTITELRDLSSDLKGVCALAKSKAIEAHYKTLIPTEDIEYHKLNKTVHMQFVKTLDSHIAKIATKIARLETYSDLVRNSRKKQ